MVLVSENRDVPGMKPAKECEVWDVMNMIRGIAEDAGYHFLQPEKFAQIAE
jgi:hypothetical protein